VATLPSPAPFLEVVNALNFERLRVFIYIMGYVRNTFFDRPKRNPLPLPELRRLEKQFVCGGSLGWVHTLLHILDLAP
jgi:hypothetical protein